jgi:hypothetical protein
VAEGFEKVLDELAELARPLMASDRFKYGAEERRDVLRLALLATVAVDGRGMWAETRIDGAPGPACRVDLESVRVAVEQGAV